MLENYTTKDLKKEIERRENMAKAKPPAALPNKDFNDTIAACHDYVAAIYENIITGEFIDIDNLKHCIFESAMNAVYSRCIWDWIDERGY